MVLPRQELGREIRCLMRSLRSASLSTGLATVLRVGHTGPMVTVAIDQGAHPLLLLCRVFPIIRTILPKTAALLCCSSSQQGSATLNVAPVSQSWEKSAKPINLNTPRASDNSPRS